MDLGKTLEPPPRRPALLDELVGGDRAGGRLGNAGTELVGGDRAGRSQERGGGRPELEVWPRIVEGHPAVREGWAPGDRGARDSFG